MKSKIRVLHALTITVLALMAFCDLSHAQNITAAGKVTDASGEPVVGASIIERSSETATITDLDGLFSLNVPQGSELEISCIGYSTVHAQAAANMNIVLDEDKLLLEEAVAVGYGTMKKKDITGAMVSVSSDEITSTPSNNAIEALQGKAAGVVISTAAIRPGSVGTITIRGTNSIAADSSPLFVIDGIIGQSVDLDMINPQDIESIEILKDASATAIYGARGGNGVVLVTTKRGDSGKVTLNYSGTVTLDKIYDKVPSMTAAEAIDWRRWGYYYAGLGPRADEPTLATDRSLFTYYGPDETAWANILRGWDLTWDQWNSMSEADRADWSVTHKWDGSKVATTDWTQFSDRIGVTQEHSLSASGGNENFNGYVSFGYLDQQGVNLGQDYERYTIRASFDAKPVKWFRMGGAVNTRYSVQELAINNSDYLHSKARRIFTYALPYDESGNIIDFPGGDYTRITTIVGELGNSATSNQNYQISASIYGELDFGQIWEPLKGLTFRTNFGPQFSLYQHNMYQSAQSVNKKYEGTDYVESQGRKRFSWLIDNILSYSREFGDHSFNATLLQEAWAREDLMMYNMNGTGVALGMTQTWWGLNTSTVGTLNTTKDALYFNDLTESQMASYMARLNYSWKNRYIATVSYRYDGASQLGEGHKWAGFPSVALGWRLDQENFLKDVSWIDQLKLRVGWGMTGNYSVGVYSTKPTMDTVTNVHKGEGSVNYYTPGALANQALGWETTTQYNVGTDFAFLNNRISGVLDFYYNVTNGLIFEVTLPSVSGFTETDDNVGIIHNKGFDFTLNTINITNSELTWKSIVNLSYNNNEIIELQNGKEDMISDGLFIGQPIHVLYGYQTDGLWTESAEDLAEMAKFNANGHLFEPGMVKPVDQNGDYKIDQNYDRVVLGNTTPLWNLGFTNTVTWKNLEFSIFLYGAFDYLATTSNAQTGRDNVSRINYWNENNKVGADYQKPIFGTAGGDPFYDSLIVRDASFLKVRQISVAYNLPRKFVNSLGLNNIKISAQLKNPFSIYQGTFWMDSDLGSGTYTKGLVFNLNIGF